MPYPTRSARLRCAANSLMAVGVLGMGIAIALLWRSPQEPHRPAADMLQQQHAHVQMVGHLVGERIAADQQLLGAFTQTLSDDIFTDGLALRAWVRQYGNLLAKACDMLWIVPVQPAQRQGNTATAHAPVPRGSAVLVRAGKPLVEVPLSQDMQDAVAHTLQTGRMTTSDLHYREPEGWQTHAMVLAAPVLNPDGQVIAVLAAGWDMGNWLFHHEMFASQEGMTAPLNVFLARRDGAILSHAGTQAASDIRQVTQLPEPSAPVRWAAMQALSHGQLVSLADVPGTPWLIGATAPVRNEAPKRDLDQTWLVTGGLLGLLLALTGLLAPWVAQWLRAAWRKQGRMHAVEHTSRRARIARFLTRSAAWPDAHDAPPTPQGTVLDTPLAQAFEPSASHTAWTGMALNRPWLRANGACLILARHGRIVDLSQGALELLGLTREAATGMAVEHLLANRQDIERLRTQLAQALPHGGCFTALLTVATALRQKQAVWLQVFATQRGQPRLGEHLLIQFEPVALRLARLLPAEEAAAPLRLDTLTSLPSLEDWRRIIAHLVRQRAPRSAAPASLAQVAPAGHLFYLDVDGFSVLVSNGGQALGNEALRYITNTLVHVLASHAPGTAVATRVSRDGFAFFTLDTSAAQALAMAHQLRDTVANLQASYLGTPMALSVSIGIAELPMDTHLLDASFHAADLACYEATSRGGSMVIVASERHCVEDARRAARAPSAAPGVT